MTPSGPGTTSRGEPARLLLAEDEEDVLITLAAVLRQAGYDVTPVRGADEGAAALRRGEAFDLIVTDMRMEHDASGLELVSEARKLDPQSLAIVLTGYGSFPSAVESLQAGVFDYLTKPSDLDQLKQAIARGLEKRQLSRALLDAERARAAQAEAERHAREAMLRADVSLALAEPGALPDILGKCAEALVRHLQAAYARIWILELGDTTLGLAATAGVGTVSGPLERTTLSLGSWKIGRAAQDQQPQFSDDLPNDPHFSDAEWAKREGMSSFAAYPMVIEGRTVGAVAIFSRAPFSEPTLDAMHPVAAAIAQGIERRRAGEQRDRLLHAESEARARAEAAERRLERIIEALPEGVIVADPEGHALLWNAAAIAISGGIDPSVNVRGYSEMGVTHLDGQPWASEETPLARAILRGETVQGEQMVLRNQRSGEPVPILASAAPIHDVGGKLLGGVTVFQDISAMKELEQQKDDFLSAAAHDLKTPLTSVKGLVQLLQRQQLKEAGAPASTAAILASIDGASTKMAHLIDELLDVSRLEMNQDVDLMLRAVDLVRLIQRAIEEQQQGTQRHQLRLETDLAALVTRCDPDRVERVLQNLLSNAVKYSPAGGEVVVALTQEEHDGHRWAAISVTDPGVGIPAADLPRIFDRFERGGNVRGRIAGTGIGLAYVSEIARRHGGSVAVASQEGHGSTFTLRLPLS
ncbi:MAG: ATP-binding protein [Chloroflexota bacterium]